MPERSGAWAARPFRFACQAKSAGTPDGFRALARRAEDLGYSSFSLPDHYLGPGPALDAAQHPPQDVALVPALMVAAEATSTIRVSCRVACVGYHEPAVLAKELATIDWFSGGRLEAGLGAGWIRSEYDALGIPFPSASDRIDRLEETVQLVRSWYAGAPLDTTGTHVTVTGFAPLPVYPSSDPADAPSSADAPSPADASAPRRATRASTAENAGEARQGAPGTGQPPVFVDPVTASPGVGRRRAGPPIMIGGGSRRVLELAGREADIVSVNFDNRSGVLGPDSIAAADEAATEEKLRWVRAGASGRAAPPELEIGAYFVLVTDARDAVLPKFAARLGLSGDKLAAHPHALIGSPAEIADELQRRRDRFGFSYITVDAAAAAEAFAPVVARLTGS